MAPAQATTAFRLYLLGAFRLESRKPRGTDGRDARVINLPTRQVKSLLAYLAIFPQPHPREKLASIFWGDSTDAQARHSLRTALATLRKELGDELVLADYDTVQLNPDFPLWIDAKEIESPTSDLSTTLRTSLSLSLYRGDLLPDFYDDWVAPERERLRTLFINATLDLVQELRARSEYQRAIEFAQKILVVDRANERAHQHLMFCYLAASNRDAALKQYEECKRALQTELAVEPSSETTALYQWLAQTPVKSREAQITNLPIPLTSFIGREREMAQVKQLFVRARLVTLTGAGGSGKTRLAIQVGTDLVDAPQFKDGVWWVDLAPLADGALVPNAVAKALGVRESPSEPLSDTLANYLRDKQLLLLLDNCEHLLQASAQLAAQLLSTSPQLKILATSRQALGISGETIWNVPTLSAPSLEPLPPISDLPQYESVRLLVDRAAAVKTDFGLTQQNAPAVAQICSRLDGIPLAIELAAARVKVLPVQQIAARLNDRFQLLTVGSSTALPRHQTLGAMMDWGYELLAANERALLRRLSVFAGGWTLEGARALYGEANVSEYAVLDLLTRLVDKSLVVAGEWKGEARYRFLESLRQYGAARLAEAGEMDAARHRHAILFAELAETAEPGLHTPEMRAWLERIEIEHDNFRAALEWSLEHESPEFALRFGGALGIFWSRRGYLVEGRQWLERLLARGVEVSPQLRARTMMPLGWIAWAQGDFQKGKALDEECIALYRASGEMVGMVDALNQRGQVAVFENDFQRAGECFAQSLKICDELNYHWGRAWPLLFQAQVNLFMNQWDAHAQAIGEESLELFRELDDKTRQAHAHIILGEATHAVKDFERGRWHLDQAVALSRAAGDKAQLTWSVLILGLRLRFLNQLDEAARAVREGLYLAIEIDDKTTQAIGTEFLGLIASAQGSMERAARLFGASSAVRESVGYQYAAWQVFELEPEWQAARAALERI